MRQLPALIHNLSCLAAGKSTIAQQLAARLNMPNVMQTDVICEVGYTGSRIPGRTVRPRGERRNPAYMFQPRQA